MRKIILGGLDPSLRNFGLAKAYFDIDTEKLEVFGLELCETAKETGKVVRQNSDDLRRGGEICSKMHAWIEDCAVVFGEIPSGAQSAAAAKALGISTGLLSTIGHVGPFNGRLVQVTASEVKYGACGSKNAAKHEMIEWATTTWPDAPWMKTKKGVILGKNEHLADACGAIHAGIRTDQFKQLVQLFRSVNSKAA